MKTKVWLGIGVGILLIAGLAAGGFWWSRRPQVITFSDGSKLTLVAVDYGKKHAPPAVKAAPPAAGSTPTRRNGSFTTTDNILVAWIRQEYDSKQYHFFQYFAYDAAGKTCVPAGFGNGNRQGSEVVAIRIEGFPRRQGKFFLRVLKNGNGGQEWAEQKFVIRNPARGPFASWTAAPLPDTAEDDALSVTLTKLAAGAPLPYQRDNGNADDPVNKAVQAVFQVERNGHPDTNWEPMTVESSDATGNQVAGAVGQNQWNDQADTVVYQPGLWPDEPAWKLRFEFSQKSNFADAELWTIRNIPLLPGRQMDFYNNRRSATNTAFASADLNGFQVKIFPAMQFSDMPPNAQPQGGLFIQTEPPLPNGMRLTLASLTDDQTNDIGYWNGGWSGGGRNAKSATYNFSLRDLGDATNLNLTLALHKSRFVEFTVKPEPSPGAKAP